MQNLRKLFNTLVRLPVKITRAGIFWGKWVVERDSNQWRTESVHKTDWYLELDGLARVLLMYVCAYASKDDRLLDICCNVGRHINGLVERGYSDVHGFDIMSAAVDRMKLEFPLISDEKIRVGSIIEILPDYPDGYFDFAYTHTATLELIHPSVKVEKELARIVKKGLIFLLNEDGQSYPRFYEYLYNKVGFFTLRKIVIEEAASGRLLLYVFIKKEFLEEYSSTDFHLSLNIKAK